MWNFLVQFFFNLSLSVSWVFSLPKILNLEIEFENPPPSEWHLFSMVWFFSFCDKSSTLVLIKIGSGNSQLFSKPEGHLSIVSSFSGNVLFCLLRLGVTTAPDETGFVLVDELTANSDYYYWDIFRRGCSFSYLLELLWQYAPYHHLIMVEGIHERAGKMPHDSFVTGMF